MSGEARHNRRIRRHRHPDILAAAAAIDASSMWGGGGGGGGGGDAGGQCLIEGFEGICANECHLLTSAAAAAAAAAAAGYRRGWSGPRSPPIALPPRRWPRRSR